MYILCPIWVWLDDGFVEFNIWKTSTYIGCSRVACFIFCKSHLKISLFYSVVSLLVCYVLCYVRHFSCFWTYYYTQLMYLCCLLIICKLCMTLQCKKPIHFICDLSFLFSQTDSALIIRYFEWNYKIYWMIQTPPF